jgi:hypothetical protein
VPANSSSQDPSFPILPPKSSNGINPHCHFRHLTLLLAQISGSTRGGISSINCLHAHQTCNILNISMADSENQDEKQNHNAPTVTLKRVMLWVTPFFACYMAELFLLTYVLPDKYEDSLRMKARTSPDLSKPCLNFFQIPYDNQTHKVSPFLIKDLSDILGTICSSCFCSDTGNVTDGNTTLDHYYALGEDDVWKYVNIDKRTDRVERVSTLASHF